ncbi:MAG: heavy metal-responsive transcriptional regulator [Burkholderiales bacterium]|nr:heavy metal-responsive transcriptional regulator [Burkholderiales bacterium]
MENLTTIGKLAKAQGVRAATLRYYEQMGLVPATRRTAAGYRVYGEDAARRLHFIRRAQALGFSLEEIAELLNLSDRPHASAGEVKKITRRKIAEIETRVRDLERMKRALMQIEHRCSGHGSTAKCPILAALGEDRS